MGIFIVFEGIDGSGQSTQSKLLSKYLRKNGYKVWLTKEPTKNTKIGKFIRNVLKTKSIDNLTIQLLMMADRVEHQKEIKEKLEKNYVVISDRYFFSTIAYGSIEEKSYLKILADFNTKFFVIPDLTFILDVDPKIAIQRIKVRKTKEIFEREEILKKVRENYLEIKELLKNKLKIFLINASKNIEEVNEQIIEIFNRNYG